MLKKLSHFPFLCQILSSSCCFYKSFIAHLQSVFIFFLVIFFFPSVLAATEQESSEISKEMLLNEPSCFVNRSVNVITGNYHENQIDMEVAGPHPLLFQRSYISGYTGGSLGYQWNINHYGVASVPCKNYDFDNYEMNSKVRVTGDCGTSIFYEAAVPKSKNEATIYSVRNDMFQKHMTNYPDIGFSAGSHVKNNRLLFEKKERKMSLMTGDGYVRHYKLDHDRYCMEDEEQPNGCVLCYDISHSKKNAASRIVALKNKETKELSSFSTRSQDGNLKMVLGSDGKWVKYHYKAFDDFKYHHQSYLQCVEGSDIPTQTYEYSKNKFSKSPKISRKNLPDDRFLCIQYYEESKNDNGNDRVKLGCLDPRIDRVMLQMAPVGFDASPIITYRYFYQLREKVEEYLRIALGGYTTVYDAHNNKIDYHFNDDYRMTDICKWGAGNEHVHSIERSYWAPNDTSNSTNLMSRTLENGKSEIKLCRSYSYDRNGNPIQKKIWGNLTGCHVGNILLDSNHVPVSSSSECFVKSFTYSTNTPHLLLSESDGKKTIQHLYQPNTNLNTARLVKVGDKIHKREFNTFDKNGCLQSVTVDDGTTPNESDHASITERRLTCIQNTTEAPIGLPQIIDQKYVDFDSNEHVLLGRVVNTHSAKGKLLSQEHYDSEYTLRFTLHWEYDAKGNLIKEVDALGRVINRRYDQNRNLVYEEGPCPGVYKEFTYDFVNRLIGTTEVHSDGVKLTASFRYDFLGNKIASIDSYGQETRYVYDNQNRLVKTVFPAVFNEEMVPVNPTTLVEYDLFDNPCRLIDAVGGITTIFYTAHNKPFYKTYPDGTAEKFEYDVSGNLVMSIAQNGTKVAYQYDPFDRLIEKEIFSSDNESLQKESNVYNAFHLLSKTDSAGMVTYYPYDKAGRLISTTQGEMRTEYEYDTLGRESKVSTFYGAGRDEYTVKIREYDLLNRIIEERTEDPSGNILTKEGYGYDISGNCQTVSKFNQAGESLTHTQYDTRGQVVSITNAVGDQTYIYYKYDYYDKELFQNLPYSESTDPQGVTTVCIKDALGRNKTEYKKNPFGVVLQKRNYYYTQTGLLSRTIEEVFIDGVSNREVVNVCRYNSAGKLIEICESEGTSEQKVTKFHYNSHGQKQEEVKPDGTTLHSDYDPLGRLKEYKASDESFHYIFEYDLNSNLIRVSDKVHNKETLKSYDEYNRLSKETLANGLSLQYLYDLSGKPTKVIFPDGSGMGLSYENLFLKEIYRISQKGEKLYEHTYDSYDLSGNVIESTLIGKGGKVNYEIDLKGRLIDVTNDRWSSSILNFDNTGNVTKKSSRDDLGSYSSEFNYNELNQLVEELGNFQEKYACDSLYNRIRKGSFDHSLNHLNQITHDGKNSYEYDRNGNLTRIENSDSEVKLSYDALNRLIKVEKDGQQITYIYDEMNRRIEKSISILDNSSQYTLYKSFKYFYQELNEIGCYEDGELIELRLLGIGKGAEIGAAIAMEFKNDVYAPIHDLHGNVICLIEAKTGNVKEFYRYSAFGEESLYDASSHPLEAAINPWRFSSKRTDEETGFVYFGRRYYDSGLGRWITPDPIGFEGRPNLYAYVMNNPLTHLDLYGLHAVDSSAQGERSCLSSSRDFVSSIYEGIRDSISSIYRSIGEGLSRFASSLSERFSSDNERRQVRFHQKILASSMNRLPTFTYPMGSGDYTGIGLSNGINTSVIQNQSNAEIISGFAGGGQISSTVNPTNGFLHDLFRAFHSLHFDLASNVVLELHNKWNAHFEQYGPHKIWLEICHSEGAINVRNALMCYNPELAQRIDVVAIAPACYIDEDLCHTINHYVSTRDFVPCIDIKGRIRNRETTHVLSAEKGANFWDHDFQSPTYSRVIEDHVQQHLRDNGY